jgi:hypothetical protein
MQENDSFGKVIYMGDVHGPEKVNYFLLLSYSVSSQSAGSETKPLT